MNSIYVPIPVKTQEVVSIKTDRGKLKRRDTSADTVLHHQIGELMHDDVPLPPELEASELLLSYCEAYDTDQLSTMEGAVADSYE